MNERQRKRNSNSYVGGARANGTDAPLPQFDGVEHRFVDLPGLRMHVAEAGEGPPLLLLHGFPQHWWAWRKVIPELARDYRVICPDLRGAGWTDAPPEGYERDQLVTDVVNLLNALHLDRVNLVGYDWGGLLGFKVCLAHPDRVARFVSIAAPHPYPEFHARMLLYLWRVWPMFAIAMPRFGPWLLRAGRQRLPRWLMTSDTTDRSTWAPKDIDIFVERLRDPARARAGSTLYRDFIFTETNRGMAGHYRHLRLRTPTLSLYGTVLYRKNEPSGEHPEILSGFERYADDFSLEFVPNAGFYIAEERPGALVTSIRRFLGAPHDERA
jgi:pimeloyl-ACP methyl ester carboxylesterase